MSLRRRLQLSLILLSLILATSIHALEPARIWEQASPSVLRVEGEMFDGERRLGSGFLLEHDGKILIVSERSVVAGAKMVRVGQSDTNLFDSPGYRISSELDLALIERPSQLSAPPLKPRTKEVQIGERVYALGFPFRGGKSISQGIIGSQTETLLNFDAGISKESGGSPLVDSDGRAVAVITVASKPEGVQLLPGFNSGIKTSAIPRTEVFQDPILSFYDAWLKLVRLEAFLCDRIADLRLIDLLAYLDKEMIYAVMPEAYLKELSAEDILSNQKEQATRLSAVLQRHKSLASASKAITTFLKEQDKALAEIPNIFAGVAKQPLLNEFLHDKRPGGLARLNITQSELVPLLKLSLEHPRAKYEDAAFRVEWLARNLSHITNRNSSTSRSLAKAWKDAQSESDKDAKRRTVRLDFSQSRVSEADEIRFLIKASVPYGAPVDILNKLFDKTLSNEEKFREYGGLEGELTGMFQAMAIAALGKGDTDKAMGLIRNEIAHRRWPSLHLLAHFNSCAGNLTTAYELYLKAFTQSPEQIDPFSLKENRGVDWILNEALADPDGYWSYPSNLRQNLKAWKEFLSGKPGTLAGGLPSLKDALLSREWRQSDALQRGIAIKLFSDAALKSDSFGEFFKQIRNDPEIAAFYSRYF
jgi:hypothetical protein